MRKFQGFDQVQSLLFLLRRKGKISKSDAHFSIDFYREIH